MKISVIGLGKLGAGTAACFTYVGYDVIGVDKNQNIVDLINKRIAPVPEPLLQNIMNESLGVLEATTDLSRAINETDISFIMLPTPSNPNGSFSDEYLREVLFELSSILKTSSKPYHNFVIMSTVIPGTINESLIPLVEQTSGRKLNKGFGMSYNPEFIALGSFIHDFLYPDFVLIGESKKEDGDIIEEIYKRVCGRSVKIARMSIINAEIVKLSLSPFVTMKIAFVNALADICDNIEGADIDAITEALGMDSRIGTKCLKTGMSFGGTCFPRDNPAFEFFAKKYNCESPLSRTVHNINEYHTDYIYQRTLDYLKKIDANSVSILGLAYKPNTPVIEDSPTIKIIERLLSKDINIYVYDRLALRNVQEKFGDKLHYCDSVYKCINSSPLIVITTMDEEWKMIDDSYFENGPHIIFDIWRILSDKKFRDNIIYIGLGKYNV